MREGDGRVGLFLNLHKFYVFSTTRVPLHLMQRRGRPLGGLSSPVPGRMEDTAETSD
jgi:hypothetical protein